MCVFFVMNPRIHNKHNRVVFRVEASETSKWFDLPQKEVIFRPRCVGDADVRVRMKSRFNLNTRKASQAFFCSLPKHSEDEDGRGRF